MRRLGAYGDPGGGAACIDARGSTPRRGTFPMAEAYELLRTGAAASPKELVETYKFKLDYVRSRLRWHAGRSGLPDLVPPCRIAANWKLDIAEAQKLRDGGISCGDIGLRFGCSEVTVFNNTAHPSVRPPSPKRKIDYTEAQRLRDDGVRVTEIAARYGVSRVSIYLATTPAAAKPDTVQVAAQEPIAAAQGPEAAAPSPIASGSAGPLRQAADLFSVLEGRLAEAERRAAQAEERAARAEVALGKVREFMAAA